MDSHNKNAITENENTVGYMEEQSTRNNIILNIGFYFSKNQVPPRVIDKIQKKVPFIRQEIALL